VLRTTFNTAGDVEHILTLGDIDVIQLRNIVTDSLAHCRVICFSIPAAENWLKIPEISVQFPKFPVFYHRTRYVGNQTTISGIIFSQLLLRMSRNGHRINVDFRPFHWET